MIKELAPTRTRCLSAATAGRWPIDCRLVHKSSGDVRGAPVRSVNDRLSRRNSGQESEVVESGEGSLSCCGIYQEGCDRLLRADRAGDHSASGGTRADAQALSRRRGWRTVLREECAKISAGVGEDGADLERGQPAHSALCGGRRFADAGLAGQSGRAGVASVAGADDRYYVSDGDGV